MKSLRKHSSNLQAAAAANAENSAPGRFVSEDQLDTLIDLVQKASGVVSCAEHASDGTTEAAEISRALEAAGDILSELFCALSAIETGEQPA